MKKFLRGIWLFLRHGPAKVADWQEQSICDALTGLYNSRFLLMAGKRELARAKRLERKTGTKYAISAVSVDIRTFKTFNDKEGHPAGDEVLRRVAVLLKKVFRREVDIVCRIGGDEFVVLLPETTVSEATENVDRLRSTAKELHSPGGRSIGLDCGVAEIEEGSLEELLKKADRSMYQQKRGLKP